MDRISLLTSYLEDSPQDPFLHFALAKEYENMGDLGKAIEKYEYLINQHSDYVGTYYHAGKIYEKVLKYDRALECYDLGLEQANKVRDRHSASELSEAKESLESSL